MDTLGKRVALLNYDLDAIVRDLKAKERQSR